MIYWRLTVIDRSNNISRNRPNDRLCSKEIRRYDCKG